MRPVKFSVFRSYGWISSVAALVVIWAFGVRPQQPEWGLLLTGVTLVLSFAYFVQKQKLDETRLFADFFTRFNDRYDRLNDELLGIIEKPQREQLQPAEIRVLVDYFNLCGEEYLIWTQGYLLPEVWESWFKAMNFYFRQPRIQALWKRELATESYYGLERLLKYE